MALTYHQGILHWGSTDLAALAAGLPTPFYAYHLPTVLERARLFRAAFPRALVAVALKANRHPGLLRALAREGLGADVVSWGEWQVALAAGFPPARVVVNGNAKSDALLRATIAAGVHSLNLDAREEIPRVAAAARAVGRVARVALRLNPGLDVHTHRHLQVAARGSHFGLPPEDWLPAAREVQGTPELRLVGVHLHAGSQLLHPADWQALGQAMQQAVEHLRTAGVPVDQVNWGGGLGVTYTDAPDPTPQDLAAALAPFRTRLGTVAEVFEPGRWLLARAGVLVVRVIQVKRAWGKRFIAVDGGMNALLRPALYAARHRIWSVRQGETRAPATVVGPNCESADVLARDVLLPTDVAPGDLLAVLDTGAYGASMANGYNARPLPGEVLLV